MSDRKNNEVFDQDVKELVNADVKEQATLGDNVVPADPAVSAGGEKVQRQIKADEQFSIENLDDGYVPPSGFKDAVKSWGLRTAYSVKSGCAEVVKFFRNPSRYVKAAKGKNFLQIKPPETEITHNEENVLEVNGVKKYFAIKKGLLKRTVGYVRAVDGVSFNIKAGTTMGLVGESGCGKTTVGRTILRLIPQTSGEILFRGRSLNAMGKKELRAYRPNIQIVFQDPYSSLSPRMPVGEIIGEAVRQHKIVPPEEFDDYISKIMRDCGLQEYHKNRYPHEFSGGQRQRICIARALALDPKFIVCDEPVSALDVSIQAQIINLLKDLQKKYHLTYLFISHDLSVVEHISDTVGVMYLGSMVEYSDTEKVFSNPLHPYTEALFSAIPVPDPDYKMNRIILEGSIPSPANPPKGCKFHTRCRDCREVCKHVVPTTVEAEPGHFVACHKYCSAQEYNDPDYKFEEERTPEFVRAELAAKIAELYAAVPVTKAKRIKLIEDEYAKKLAAVDRVVESERRRKTDELEHDRVILKLEVQSARAAMYQKLNAFPENERVYERAPLETELKAEIESIKARKVEADEQIKQKTAVFQKEAEDKKQAYKAKVDEWREQQLKALDEEIPEDKAGVLERDAEACEERARLDAKELKKQYAAEIKKLEREREDKYIKAYEEGKIVLAEQKTKLQAQRAEEERIWEEQKAKIKARDEEHKRIAKERESASDDKNK